MVALTVLGKALADTTRLRILLTLRQSPLCVCELADALEVGMSTLSTHLQVIRESGLVETNRTQKWIEYSIAPDMRDWLNGFFALSQGHENDKRILRDRARLAHRLELRQAGCCVEGVGALNRLKGGEGSMACGCSCGCCTCDPCECTDCQCCSCGKE